MFRVGRPFVRHVIVSQGAYHVNQVRHNFPPIFSPLPQPVAWREAGVLIRQIRLSEQQRLSASLLQRIGGGKLRVLGGDVGLGEHHIAGGHRQVGMPENLLQ